MARTEPRQVVGARLVRRKVSLRMVTLIATESYPYAERSLSPGDVFEASEKDAALLKLIGRATDAPARRLRTRDIQPESASDGETPRQKRSYQRRDMTPEV